MKDNFTPAQISDIVEQWLADNPERLDLFYDDITSVILWKREAGNILAFTNDKRKANAKLEKFATQAENEQWVAPR